MLSFSTKGSAKHENVDKVANAVKLVHEQAPELNVDGEMQADAALVSSVGDLKLPGQPGCRARRTCWSSRITGGNIGYKLVQRLGNAKAIGPVIQGSGCKSTTSPAAAPWRDIVDVVRHHAAVKAAGS